MSRTPGRCQSIIRNNAALLLTGRLRANFINNSIKIKKIPILNIHLKMSNTEWWPFCLGLNVLNKTKSRPYASCVVCIIYWFEGPTFLYLVDTLFSYIICFVGICFVIVDLVFSCLYLLFKSCCFDFGFAFCHFVALLIFLYLTLMVFFPQITTVVRMRVMNMVSTTRVSLPTVVPPMWMELRHTQAVWMRGEKISFAFDTLMLK